jgi:hypothetical protein
MSPQFLEVGDIVAASKIEKKLPLKGRKMEIAPLRMGIPLNSREQYFDRFKKPNSILLKGSPFQLKPRPTPPSPVNTHQKLGDEVEEPAPFSEQIKNTIYHHNPNQEDLYASFCDDIKGWEDESAANITQNLASYHYCNTYTEQSILDLTNLSISSQQQQNQDGATKRKKKVMFSKSNLLKQDCDEAKSFRDTQNSIEVARPKTAPANSSTTRSSSASSNDRSKSRVLRQECSFHAIPFLEVSMINTEHNELKKQNNLRIKQCKSASPRTKVSSPKDSPHILGKKYMAHHEVKNLFSNLQRPSSSKSILPQISLHFPITSRKSWAIASRVHAYQDQIELMDKISPFNLPLNRNARKLSASGFQPSKVLLQYR